MHRRRHRGAGRLGRWLAWATCGLCAPLAADPWPPGTYHCKVENAVGIHVHRDRVFEGPLSPDPAEFTLKLAPLDSDCGSSGIAHATVGIALRCAKGSSTADVGGNLGGTLYRWMFPGPTFIDVQGTTMLQLGGRTSFMWTFVTADYTSTYHGSCRAAGNAGNIAARAGVE